jgi:leucyl-tRNA synthetase
MFLGHYFDGGDWSDQHIIGVRKFLNRWDLWTTKEGSESIDTTEFVKQVDGFVRSFKFNKVVSSFMEFYNKNKGKNLDEATRNKLRETISCFAPTKYKK